MGAALLMLVIFYSFATERFGTMALCSIALLIGVQPGP